MYTGNRIVSFQCKGKKGSKPQSWPATLRILKAGNPCEAELEARGSYFHLIAGTHSYGNFICIPNWDIGTELAEFGDVFWNEERLRNYTSMKNTDACSVAAALKYLADHTADRAAPVKTEEGEAPANDY